jgi:FecR protein
MKIQQSAWIGLILFSVATGAHAVVEAGRVQFVFGVAHAIGGEGGQRQLAKAQPVYAGETIVTGPTASLQLRMIDKAVLAIRPNSQVHIETYHLADSSGQAILRLVQGSLRSVTGLIGQLHSDNYRIITNRAYLGVRGTDHEPSHILPGEAGGAEPGTYDKVNTGATFLAGPGGRVDLDPNEVGFASNLPGAAPMRLEGVPAFMRPTPAIADGGLSGETHPGRVEAPAGTERRIALRKAEPGVVTQKQTAGGSVNFTAGTFAAGAPRVAGVYGDMTGTLPRNGAFIAVRNPAENFFAGKAKALGATDPSSKLVYTRGPAPEFATGSGSFSDDGTTVVVNWGIYGTGAAVNGHAIKDQYSAGSGREPNYAHLMAALETPAPVLATLSGTYTSIVTSSPIIAESGAPGGSLTSATIVLANGKLTQYDIAATDALARNWTGNCASCAGGVSLANFRDSGIGLSGTGPTGGPATGTAHGQAVGPTGKGVVSSFALQEGTAAITGSFAVTK